MKEYNLIVIGTGSGMEIAQKAPGVGFEPATNGDITRKTPLFLVLASIAYES